MNALVTWMSELGQADILKDVDWGSLASLENITGRTGVLGSYYREIFPEFHHGRT